MKHYWLYIFWLVWPCYLAAQDVTAINYGLEAPFHTNTVYNVHYAKNNRLYIATDKGIWSYNGLKFLNHPFSNKQTIEASYIRESPKGDIYVVGFNGRAYKLGKDGQWYLHKLLPEMDEKIVEHEFIGDDHYYITRSDVYCESPNGKITKKNYLGNVYLVKLYENGILQSLVFAKTTLYNIADTTVVTFGEVMKENYDKFEFSYGQQWVAIHGQHLIDEKGDTLFSVKENLKKIKPLFVKKIKNRLFLACGLGLYDVGRQELLLKDKYITGIEEDREGNVWVSTLNGGLYKIYNLDYRYYPITNKKEGADFVFFHDDQLLYSDGVGNLYQWKKGTSEAFRQFYKSTTLAIVRNIFYDSFAVNYISSGNECNIFDSSFSLRKQISIYGEVRPNLQEHSFCRSYKNQSFVFKEQLTDVIADYYKLGGKPILLWEDKIRNVNLSRRNETYFLNGDVNSKKIRGLYRDQLMYSSQDSLFLLHKKTLDWQYVILPDVIERIYVENDKLYFLSESYLGELDEEGKVVQKIERKDGLEYLITNFSTNDQYICISTAKKIHILDVQTLEKKYQFTPNNGIKAIDFSRGWLYEDRLYVNGSEGISEIILDTGYHIGKPVLSIAEVKANNTICTTKELAYDQNNIELLLEVKSYTAKGILRWRIKDQEWTELTNSSRISLPALESGRYRIEVVFENELGAYSNTVVYQFFIQKPYWETGWFWLLIGGNMVALGWLWYRRRLSQIHAKNQLENQLVASQMTALKSQMNPHFIFNALNSIQSLIRFNKNKEAYKYVNKFALLLRETLYYSDKDYIPLEREIGMLEHYLEMEKMRFDDQLDFRIRATCSTDIAIPSMIIQPFVENSIKHGLLHKTEGQKILTIDFVDKDKDTICCTVVDNGIGRERAAKIVAQQKHKNPSFSTGATQKRLELLQQLKESALGVFYTDLYDEDNNPIGTQVEIIIPVD